MKIEVTIPDEDDNQQDYKTLRDKALLERYLEKQQREITEEPAETYNRAFDKKFGAANINTIDDVLHVLFLKSKSL